MFPQRPGARLRVAADLRDADEVLSSAGKLLDFTQPVGLLFVVVAVNIFTFRQASAELNQSLTAISAHDPAKTTPQP